MTFFVVTELEKEGSFVVVAWYLNIFLFGRVAGMLDILVVYVS